MIIGVPKEIKNNENRIAITPAGVQALNSAGHTVLIETNAGTNSGFSDDSFRAVGAEVLSNRDELWQKANLILKVKEPLPEEYKYFREDLAIFTYLHLASAPELSEHLLKSKATAIAYETIQLDDGSLPLLTPMSEVAGRMAIQIGAHILEKRQGGRGLLLGGVPGVEPGHVVIVGGGIVGTNAATIALGLRAKVTILENNSKRIRELDNLFGGQVQVIMSNPYNIEKAVVNADLVIGAVLVPGARAPRLVTKEMVKQMRSGSVIIDVAIDQGGCIETIDRVTTHDEPTYTRYGVVHYGVANMPGAVPYTSTIALTNLTLPYILEIASKGIDRAMEENKFLAKGLNIQGGEIIHPSVASALKESLIYS
ncbi:alanine dehydrogenase [Pseudalkalibacillus caeni]|uniref:Alanine dehydrogenase n=1 Tax=Exobacillus caeni TaxID=2574798 RepID=A0A5R9FGE8_9BACL|nr:alanine dehydrogenase [Pseudalkalibacillus caeni]TLS38615.1 alanine dehydrogenase [Pseudalkalibacillus caeni]